MIRLLADENFDNRIIRGLKSKNSDAEILRVQDTEIYQADDMSVLAWAAERGYVLLTHDINTMTDFVNQRIMENLPMYGVIFVQQDAPIGPVIEDLLIAIGVYEPDELMNSFIYLPTK